MYIHTLPHLVGAGQWPNMYMLASWVWTLAGTAAHVFLGKTIHSHSPRARFESKILEEGPRGSNTPSHYVCKVVVQQTICTNMTQSSNLRAFRSNSTWSTSFSSCTLQKYTKKPHQYYGSVITGSLQWK